MLPGLYSRAMQSDPQRQWFIYYKEKEIGPISESDVANRFSAGEIDGTAYVYTEGMSDWALVGELPLFSKSPTLQSVKSSPAPLKAVTLDDSFEAEQISKVDAQSQLQQNPTVHLGSHAAESAEAATETPKKISPKKQFRPLAFAAALLALVVLVGSFLASKKAVQAPKAVADRPVAFPEASPAQAPSAPTASAGSFRWDELLAMRSSTDGAGPPFLISAKHLGDNRPIIVGALSPLLKAEALALAIYPDNERTLMVQPRVWILKVPVVDGLFTAGPLNIDGAELAPGTYHVMARFFSPLATEKSYLGEVTFEVGAWPSSGDLARQQQQVLTARVSFAQKEKAALDAKISEINAAVSELRELGKIAAQGPKSIKSWNQQAPSWKMKIDSAARQQYASLREPAFYNEAQTKVYEFLRQLSQIYSSLAMSAKDGPKAMADNNGKGMGQLWAELSTAQQQLVGEVQTLSAAPSMDLKINSELVKRQLLETN